MPNFNQQFVTNNTSNLKILNINIRSTREKTIKYDSKEEPLKDNLQIIIQNRSFSK